MRFNLDMAIGRAFGYTKDLNRLLVFTGFLILGGLFVLAPLALVYGSIALGAPTLPVILSTLIWLFLGIAVAYLVFTYTAVLFTENYATRKTLSGSASAVKPVYLIFLVATFLVGVISAIVGMVPAIGFIFSILAALVFYFVPQEVVVKKSGLDSLSRSYGIFMKNKLEVFVALIVGSLISLVIMLIFAIPLLLAGALALVSAISTGSFTAMLLANLPAFIVTGLIAVFGMAMATLFGNSFKTEVYLQLTRGKTAVEKAGVEKAVKRPARARSRKR